ncbi:MAG: SRPBCC domain-containing protein [Chloroflexota bacterium]
MSKNAKATTVKTTFSRETSISTHIAADAATVWALLTDASDMARWNSTVVSITGNIAPNGSVELVSTLDESRSFKLNIKEFIPEQRLVWGDRQGSRVYSITQNSTNSVSFTMSEKIGGFLFPLFSRFIPPFDESFEQYAADLKKEAEARFTAS